MKTIATAAILAILTAPAFAAEDKTAQTTGAQTAKTTEAGKSQASIVLSATQLDDVTAGFLIRFKPVYISSYQSSGSGY